MNHQQTTTPATIKEELFTPGEWEILPLLKQPKEVLAFYIAAIGELIDGPHSIPTFPEWAKHELELSTTESTWIKAKGIINRINNP